MRIRFLTATPLDIRSGSGTYVGMQVLAGALESLGHSVIFETPRRRLRVFTAERLVFNRSLRPDPQSDLTVGFDMDGYRIAGASPNYSAALKGVIADEVRFESGTTRLTMGIQARCERLHVRRAPRVLVTSHYSAGRVHEFYGVPVPQTIVPEPIDLAEWRALLERNPAQSRRFTVLFVGRHYRRKRVEVLLRAVRLLAGSIPELEVRIVGRGPCTAEWQELSRGWKLDAAVAWLGDVSRSQLAEEYNRAHVFCLPSVQEGFGIVLLEAMASGTPIVGARAGAIPEVAPHASLTEPDNAEALAAAIESLYRSPDARAAQARAGAAHVVQFDAPRVARDFLDAACGVPCAGVTAAPTSR